MSFCLVFFDITDKTSIGHLFVFMYYRFLFEVYGVGAFDSVADTLCESSKLVGEGSFPCVFIFAFYWVAVFLGLTGDGVSGGIGFFD